MTVRLKGFDELLQHLDLDALPPGPADEASPVCEVGERTSAEDLSELLARLANAQVTLASAEQQDQEARERAATLLAEHDRALEALREAERGLAQARDVRARAEGLLAHAFSEAARGAAETVAAQATEAEHLAALLVEARQADVEALAAQPELQRLLTERRRREEQEAEQQRAAEAERARRLSETLTRARTTLEAGAIEEAQALIGPLAKEHPTNAEVASLTSMIAWRRTAVKNAAAEEALRGARRLRRQDPTEAARLLEAVDVDGLPEPLARQVFGEWARCNARRLADRPEAAEPLRYAPDPGRGLVLAREQGGAYVVVSALGMGPAWQPGRVVTDRALLRRARPLH